jgi:hypothetical protein
MATLKREIIAQLSTEQPANTQKNDSKGQSAEDKQKE